MYGFIPAAALAFVKSLPNADQLLEEISERLDGTINTNFYSQYDDAETLRIVKTVAEVTNQSFDDMLSNMGSVQLDQFEAKGYLPLIESLGATFFEFLEHLDSLHMNLVHSYPNMKAPSFRPEKTEDGIILHYYSSRPGLWPYATALLENVAMEIYGLTIHFQHIQKKHEGHDHDIFRIISNSNIDGKQFVTAMADNKLITCDATPNEFDEMFPWHLQIDSDMCVISMGSLLALRFDPEELKKPPLRFTDIAKMVRPSVVRTDFDQLAKFENMACMLLIRDKWYDSVRASKHAKKLEENSKKQNNAHSDEVTARNRRADSTVNSHSMCPFHRNSQDDNSQEIEEFQDHTSGRRVSFAYSTSSSQVSSASSILVETYIRQSVDYLYLKGELRHIQSNNTLLFLGIPAAQKPDELYQCGLGLPDIPIHSNGRDMLFSNVHQSATVGVAAQLEQVTQDLEQARRELSMEKKKVHELLSSILPQSVIKYLAQGQEAPAERFENVSILFSDIVSFTKISSAVRPTQVMDMLNDLFLRFDKLCDKHSVYKVETIGDAYMVVSGLPERSPDHAPRLCAFAMDMMAASREVLNPVDGSPIRMRIGMHSGSVMAGVVGQTRPRYCLFGDAVSIAQQMESSGVPGCVQLSASMMSELRAVNAEVMCQPRGEVELKGRGLMQTFLLVGRKDVDSILLPPVEEDEEEALAVARREDVAHVLTMCHPNQDIPNDVAYKVIVQQYRGGITTLVGVKPNTLLRKIASLAKEEFGILSSKTGIYADQELKKLLILNQPLQVTIDSGVLRPVAIKEKQLAFASPLNSSLNMETINLFLP